MYQLWALRQFLQNEWWLLKTQWYLPSFCFPTHYAESNDSDEIEGTECQNELEMASEQSIWKSIVIQRTAQPGLKAKDEQKLLLWNVSRSCIYNRGPLSLLSEPSVVWLTWLAHPFPWGCGGREGIEKRRLSIGEECDKAIQRFIWNIKQWGTAKNI